MEISDRLPVALTAVGALTCSLLAWRSIKALWVYFLRPSTSLKKRYGSSTKQNEQPWVFVTGGTSGIGLGLAKRFAKEGFNVAILARSRQNLKAVSSELAQSFNVQTRMFEFDASVQLQNGKNLAERIHALAEALRELDIAVFVNNLGVHNPIPAAIQDMSPADIERIVAINILFPTLLTRALVPQLKARSKERKHLSAILNVCSLTSRMSMPMLSLYAATKAFGEHFSDCLDGELQGSGVDVLCVRPGITVGPMSGIQTPSLFCPAAQHMADRCTSDLGRTHVIAPYAPHAFLDIVGGIVPRSVILGAVRRKHEEERKVMLTEQKRE